MRVYYHKSYNELMSISSNDINSFHTMILNFITDLSSARNLYIDKTCDVILMLINKLTKHVTYITITKDLKINYFINIL